MFPTGDISFLQSFYFADKISNFILREHPSLKTFYVTGKSAHHHILWQLCSQTHIISDEEDYGVNIVVIYVQELGHSLCMPVVLMDRALKLVFFAVQGLCPLFCSFIAKYPPIDIFCFDYKNTVPGDQNMINLGGTIKGRKYYVVKSSIDVTIELRPHAKLRLFFS